MLIVHQESTNSNIKSFMLCLGGLYLEMSFLGTIGHLMAGSGLKELLEIVYADNAVCHVLSGKAISQAIHGLFLVDAALNALLVSNAFNIPVTPTTHNLQEAMEDADDNDHHPMHADAAVIERTV